MSTRRVIGRSLGSLPVIPLLLVACANSSAGAGDGRSPTADPNDLVGVVWVLDPASMGGLVDDVPPLTQITLSFEGGSAHGSAACNNYGGSYRAGDDGSLSFDPFAVTLMACDALLTTLEGAYLEALGGVTGFAIDAGTLHLTGGQPTLSFASEPAQALPLVGTPWTLMSITSGDVATGVVSGTEITALFAADDTVTGSAGCNRFNGTYTRSAERLSVSPLATTKMACPGYVMTQERVFLDAMSQVASYTIDGTQSHLTLLDGAGASLLVFECTTPKASAG
jgi:heat shock protein HslJ